MDPEKHALQLVDNALTSIHIVIEDYKKADKKIKTKFSKRVKKLIAWHQELKSWKQNFLQTEGGERYLLLIELHTIMRQMS